MDIKEKINIVTSHLLLKKQKTELELERFINDDNSIEELCDGVEKRLNEYRDSISNVTLWLDFIEPVNEPEEGNNNKEEKIENGKHESN